MAVIRVQRTFVRDGAGRFRSTPKPGVPSPSEDSLQRAVVELLQLHEKRGDLVFCHVPNGGLRNKIVAGALKELGVQAGVPDLLLWLPGGRTVAIELKSRHGYLSPAQHAWHAAMARFGHRVSVCRSVEEVQQVLGASGVAPMGRLSA